MLDGSGSAQVNLGKSRLPPAGTLALRAGAFTALVIPSSVLDDASVRSLGVLNGSLNVTTTSHALAVIGRDRWEASKLTEFLRVQGALPARSGSGGSDAIAALRDRICSGRLTLIVIKHYDPSFNQTRTRPRSVATPTAVPRPPLANTGAQSSHVIITPVADITAWSTAKRIEYLLTASLPFLSQDLRQYIRDSLTPAHLASLIAGLLVIAGIQAIPILGEAMDAMLLGVAWAYVGWSGLTAIAALGSVVRTAATARTEAEIAAVAPLAAKALERLGEAALAAVILRMGKRNTSGGTVADSDEAAGSTAQTIKPDRGNLPRSQTAATLDDVQSTQWNQSLYRVDSRSPDVIFQDGFQPKGTSTDIQTYVDQNTPSAFVSTSKTPDIYQNPDFGAPGNYLYEVDGSQTPGVDVNAVYPANPYASEQEIAVPGGIPSGAIIGAKPILPGGGLGNTVFNPFYKAAP